MDFHIYALPTCGEAAGTGLKDRTNDGIDEDKYPILTKSKETIKLLEQELEDIEKEILAKDTIRREEAVERIRIAKQEYD
jgi:hypothetical protein